MPTTLNQHETKPSARKLLHDDLVAALHAIVKEVSAENAKEESDYVTKESAAYRAEALKNVAEAYAALDRAASARIFACQAIAGKKHRDNDDI